MDALAPRGYDTGMSALGEIEIFVAVVAAGSFTRAAKGLGISQSLASRTVAALEERLNVRLLHRTTRKLQLTTDGRAFYERCAQILADLHDAELTVTSTHERPHGRLRVDVPSLLGLIVVIPALPAFLARYPEIQVALTLRDHYVDIVGEGLDVALRMATLPDSSLVARRLGTARIVTCGAPAYLRQRGKPTTLADLANHDCLMSIIDGATKRWRFRDGTRERLVPVSGRLHITSGPAVLESVRAGLGLARLFDFIVAQDLAQGLLEEVLAAHAPEEQPIFAVYPASRHLSPKVRVFVDYLVETWQHRAAMPATPKPRPARRPRERSRG